MRLVRWLLVPIAAAALLVGIFSFPDNAYAVTVILLSCFLLHPLLLAIERNRQKQRRTRQGS